MHGSGRVFRTQYLLRKRFLAKCALIVASGSLLGTPPSSWAGWHKKKPQNSKPATLEARLTFSSLGIPGISPLLLSTGKSQLTIHFVDENHLLVTHAVRELVSRHAEDPVDDEDRIVEAALVELPSGSLLAKTRWHLHDHDRYLWNLGRGRFLLREGEALSTFAPMHNWHTPDPFFRVPLSYRHGVLDGVVVSADSELLTIEIHIPNGKRLRPNPKMLTHDGESTKPLLYLDFYRIGGDGTEASPFVATHAGVSRSKEIERLPANGDGYLAIKEKKHGHWPVEFQGFGTKSIPVGKVDSGCPPKLELAGSAQWLAFSCHSLISDNVTLMGYDFAKHGLWKESMGNLPTPPAFAFAPMASRFAISRKLETSSAKVPLSPEINTAITQEVRVYGVQTGDLLLKVNCSPAFQTAENFDLSPDGMRLAYVRDGVIEIFRLPELTKTDQESIAELQKLMPAPGKGPINLKGIGEDLSAPFHDADIAVEVPGAAPSTVHDVMETAAQSSPTPSEAEGFAEAGANSTAATARFNTVGSEAIDASRKLPPLQKPPGGGGH